MSRRPTRGRRVGAAAAVAALALLAVACTSGSDEETMTFEEGTVEDEPDIPEDGELEVWDAPEPDEVPPPDARLATGGWPEAAAFIAREAEQDNPVLVNIFASWCVPCRVEVPVLLEARDDNPDITFLGIDHMDRLEDGEEFIEELDIDFATIHDLDGDVAFTVGSRVMPTTVVFDRDGQLAGRVFGELTRTSLDNLMDEVR